MNKSTLSTWIGNAFIYGVLIFMGALTYRGVHAATGDMLISALSIALFDGGAYAGYRLLIGHAQGDEQRTAAQTILVIDFLLACGMVAGGLFLIPSTTVLWIMLGSAVFNGGMGYFYKTHDPEVLQDAKEREIEDAEFENHMSELKEHVRRQRELYRIAQQQARITLEREGQILGAALAKRATARIKNRMRLVMSDAERKALEADVIEAKAEDVPQLPAPADNYIPGWVQSFFGWLRGGQRSPQSTEPTTTTASSDSNSDEPPQDPNPPA
jgi:hypothetical protein